MNSKLLKQAKLKILELKGILIYENDYELEKICDKIINFIRKDENLREKSFYFLEVQNKILYLGEYSAQHEIKIIFEIPLLSEMDFKKVYDNINKKINTTLAGYHHIYGSSNGWQRYVYINNSTIDLISDTAYDNNWLNNSEDFVQVNRRIRNK